MYTKGHSNPFVREGFYCRNCMRGMEKCTTRQRVVYINAGGSFLFIKNWNIYTAFNQAIAVSISENGIAITSGIL